MISFLDSDYNNYNDSIYDMIEIRDKTFSPQVIKKTYCCNKLSLATYSLPLSLGGIFGCLSTTLKGTSGQKKLAH